MGTDNPQPAPVATHTETDHQLVDRIHYLTSLASDASAVDPLLDTMRLTMAQWDGTSQFKPHERAALEKIATQLTIYLVQNDPIREFTLESLEQRLHAKVADSDDKPRPIELGYGGAVILSVVGGALTMLLPLSNTLYVQLVTAAIVAMLFMTIFNAWFYLTSLTNFKPELKRVFVYLCVGSVGVGIQFVGFVSATLLHWDLSPWHRYGGLTVYAVVALAVMYLGLRKYAQLLQLHSRLGSLWWLVGIVLGAASLAAAVVMLKDSPQKFYFGFSLTDLFILSWVSFLGAALARRVAQSVTAAYAASLKLIMWWCFAVGAGAFGYTGALIWRGELNGSALSTALAILATPPVLFLLSSGYSFKRETRL